MKRPSSNQKAPRLSPRSDAALRTPVDRFKVVYIVISSLVVCSMLAVALTTIDFGGLFSGNNDTDNMEEPNADLIAEQEAIVADNPDDVDQIVVLANLLGNTGQIQKAIPWYEKALSLDPDNHGVRLDFARSLAGANLLTDAEAQFSRVLQQDPDNQTAHYYMAELYMVWSPPQEERAIEHYRRAAEIDQDSFLGERARIRMDAMPPASPAPGPISSPVGAGV